MITPEMYENAQAEIERLRREVERLQEEVEALREDRKYTWRRLNELEGNS